MKNGSLEQWLHPELLNVEYPTTLDLGQRLNIIIDIASALHYLHQECELLVLHCGLKPTNVLLDDDMVAHVSDFGIARLFSTIGDTSHENTSTIGIKGTVGYTPPALESLFWKCLPVEDPPMNFLKMVKIYITLL
ncbi:kinase-like protein [Trifolium medium]|uniref:non-specific serine/threonine protein kinase n=1 Tax=Trifolium medium TaxID=97028 RepID=A0A392NX24_9FABA|nr:kinase-like protein [Trifolium medium]